MRLKVKNLRRTAVPALSPDHAKFVARGGLQIFDLLCRRIPSRVLVLAPRRIEHMPHPLEEHNGWVFDRDFIK
jgi:hypothetical protein